MIPHVNVQTNISIRRTALKIFYNYAAIVYVWKYKTTFLISVHRRIQNIDLRALKNVERSRLENHFTLCKKRDLDNA